MGTCTRASGAFYKAGPSSCGVHGDEARALRAGFQLHLATPVQPAELATVVFRLAARREG